MSCNQATSSNLLTTDGIVYQLPCALTALQVMSTSAIVVTATVYDRDPSDPINGADAIVLAKIIMPAAERTSSVQFDSPVASNHGLYLELSPPGGQAILSYIPG